MARGSRHGLPVHTASPDSIRTVTDLNWAKLSHTWTKRYREGLGRGGDMFWNYEKNKPWAMGKQMEQLEKQVWEEEQEYGMAMRRWSRGRARAASEKTVAAVAAC